MSDQRWQRIQEIFHEALEHLPDHRAAFVREACAGDDVLRGEVESLLANQSRADALGTGLGMGLGIRELGLDLIGKQIGVYRIDSLLGAGGMGEVYRARDTKLGRDVALKILPAGFTSDAERLARFEREARMLASLNHPHIGGIYGFEKYDGAPALVLELVEGLTLAERMAANFTYSVPAPLGGVPSVFLGNGTAGVRWSPDGLRIAYVLAGGSAGDAIWIADGDGSNQRPLVPREGNLHKHWPSWSADGRYVYFHRSMGAWNAAPTEVYRVAATGGAPELVVPSVTRTAFPAPTPDGRGLIYAADPVGAELNLWWRPLARGGSVRLTTGAGEYAQPRISLNGQTMVCTLLETRDSLVRADLGSDPGSAAASTPLTDDTPAISTRISREATG